MKKISRAFVMALKENADIVDIAKELGIKLVKSHSGRYFAPCPLPNHSDQNPSFSVFTESQEFHCFGCHAHGDVVDLVILMTKRNFNGAVEYIADQVGMKVEEMDEDEVFFLWEDNRYPGSHTSADDVALFEIINLRTTLQEISNTCGADSDEFKSSFTEAEELLSKLDRSTSDTIKDLNIEQIKKLSASLRESYIEDRNIR
jgi:hypothetical protein